MAALERDDERLDPSTRVLTVLGSVLARISKRGCQTLEMTCIGWTENKNKNKTFFSVHRFVILFFDEVFIQ